MRVADLVSDSGALRFRLRLLDREGRAGPPAPGGRILAAASLEYLDLRDGEHWPLVELGALHLAPERARSLCAGLADAVRGASPGLGWQSGEPAALGLQAGALEGAPGGGWMVEVGMDLSGFLAGAAGVAPRPGVELALFRFPVPRAALVAFASALEAELGELGGA
ncbi:MAG TPA: hypothetical protein VFR85_11085 [Anaeromyxobacteraceae bacterium]|nr:hypothetical protein [Anaeromyxobacteraceae bacterium]